MTHVSHEAARVKKNAVNEAFEGQRHTLDPLLLNVWLLVPVEDVSAIGDVLAVEDQQQHLCFTKS